MIDFSFSVKCVLFDLAHIKLSFRKFVVEVDLVFCFSILHNLLIYSGKILHGIGAKVTKEKNNIQRREKFEG